MTIGKFAFGTVILAAGRSTRMGRPKMLLPWGDTSVVGHLIDGWQRLGSAQIGVVCALGDASMQAELDRVSFPAENRIFNSAPERGMFSSIQCAAQWQNWNPSLNHWALVLGDQPHLRAELLRPVLKLSADFPDKICLPRQDGHRRHPVVLPRALFEELADSTATDLKDFLDGHRSEIACCDLDDATLALDIDRPEDYERAREMFFGKDKGKQDR